MANKFGGRDRLHKHHKRNKVSLVRYADDFLITGSSKELLEDEVKPVVEAFMAERGLALSSEKTVITHVDQGFDFLGWTVRRFGKDTRSTVLVQPSKKNVKTFLDKCREVFHEMRAHAQAKVIWKLNPILRGWTNYHRHRSLSARVSLCGSRAVQDGMALGKKATSCERRSLGSRRSTSRFEVVIAGCLPVVDWTTEGVAP